MLAKFIDNRNYWVVRADGGKHFREFVERSFIGVGYIDSIANEISEVNQNLQDKIHQYFSEKNISKNKSHQLNRFLRKIQIGDIVITLNSNTIAVGRVESSPYIEKNDHTLNNKIIIRRAIEWGPTILRQKLPYELQNSLKANLTVFNINQYAIDLYHSIFPFFVRQGDLHASVNINTSEQIRSEDIANLFSTINIIEKGLEKLLLDVYSSHVSIESLVKAEFNSPGTVRIIYRLLEKKTPRWIIYAALINSIVFGNSLVGFNGIIDPGTKHIILKYLLEHPEKDEKQKSLIDLKISLPNNHLGFFNDEMIDFNDSSLKYKLLPPLPQKMKESP